MEASLYDPRAGDRYGDGTNLDCEWHVDAVGIFTEKVYLRMWRDGRPTNAEVEWPRDRWARFVDLQRLTLRAKGGKASGPVGGPGSDVPFAAPASERTRQPQEGDHDV